MAENLARLPTFWGVGVLLVLLTSLPWLPIAAAPVESPRETRVRMAPAVATLTARMPRRSDRFTVYIVPDNQTWTDVHSRIDPASEAAALVTSDEERLLLDRFLGELNLSRASAGLPEVRVVDLR